MSGYKLKTEGWIAVKDNDKHLGYEISEIEARRGAATYEFNHLDEDIRIEAIRKGDRYVNKVINELDIREYGWRIRPISFVFLDED